MKATVCLPRDSQSDGGSGGQLPRGVCAQTAAHPPLTLSGLGDPSPRVSPGRAPAEAPLLNSQARTLVAMLRTRRIPRHAPARNPRRTGSSRPAARQVDKMLDSGSQRSRAIP